MGLYGNSWEKYLIKKGQVWVESISSSVISVADITLDSATYLYDADMVYCDPPWSKANVNFFKTKAGMNNYINSYNEFYQHLFNLIKKINPIVCYLEIGKENKPIFIKELKKIFSCVQIWDIVYYKKHPCYLIRGSSKLTDYSYSGMDDAITPLVSIKNELPKCVADMCMGRGLTAIAAWKQRIKFVGCELNKRKLAQGIDKLNKLGAKYENSVP